MQFVVDNQGMMQALELLFFVVGVYFLFKKEIATYSIFISFSIGLILINGICQWKMGLRSFSKVLFVLVCFSAAVFVSFILDRMFNKTSDGSDNMET